MDVEQVSSDEDAAHDDQMVVRVLLAMAEQGWGRVAGLYDVPRARLLRVSVPPEEFRRQFRETMESLTPDLQRFAAGIVGPNLAEEVVQEACTDVFESHLRQPRQVANLEAYVQTAVRNESRTIKRRMQETSSLDDGALDLPSQHDVEATVISDELWREIESAFGRLTHREREVTLLRVVADMSEAETAQTLGLARGTVGSCLHRALSKLRSALQQ